MPTRIVPGNNGLEKVLLETPHGTAEIYRLGATITRFAAKGREMLFVSKVANFIVGKAIRGGVPICWPWFGAHPTNPKAPQHGLVRTIEWTVTEMSEGKAVLETRSTPATQATFPGDFVLTLTVTLTAAGLHYALTTANTGTAAFTLGEALHTYFNVADITRTTVTGLNGTTYVDKLDDNKLKTETSANLPVTAFTDRVYLNAAGPHLIQSPAGNIKVTKTGSADTVVWNPWSTSAEKIADLVGNQWPGFLCIEAVNTGAHTVTVPPGESHTLACQIEAV